MFTFYCLHFINFIAFLWPFNKSDCEWNLCCQYGCCPLQLVPCASHSENSIVQWNIDDGMAKFIVVVESVWARWEWLNGKRDVLILHVLFLRTLKVIAFKNQTLCGNWQRWLKLRLIEMLHQFVMQKFAGHVPSIMKFKYMYDQTIKLPGDATEIRV